MMYVNLFWVWGHPEVYILVLPAFGIFSEVVSTFSGKPLFGYRSMVAATMAICVLSFIVWLHHFFTMGASANVNGFFGVMTMIIAVPTGVKVFNWLFTMYGGRIRFTVPILWSIGFMVTFVIGGMTGVLTAVPPADFQLHNSLFLVAHFHNVIIGGVVFGLMAGYNYWFPKAFGFKLDERWGRASFWCWLIGFYLAFMPLYVLGLMGMTRRMQHYDVVSWQPWLLVAAFGVVTILAGVVCQVIQLAVSIRDREQLEAPADPWNGRTLEWATASPPPAWNFAVLPQVKDIDAFWNKKQRARSERTEPPKERKFEPVEMPNNSATGFVTAFFAVVTGFALIWHIWWMASVGAIGIFLTMLAFAFRNEEETEISAEQIARFERAHPVEIAV
jgi:cytochrome o ubiquinol oxidase subunit I